jgi:hypothetical protein
VSAGKGDGRRPAAVDAQEYAARWQRTFAARTAADELTQLAQAQGLYGDEIDRRYPLTGTPCS